jgi:hypothetical protein
MSYSTFGLVGTFINRMPELHRRGLRRRRVRWGAAHRPRLQNCGLDALCGQEPCLLDEWRNRRTK